MEKNVLIEDHIRSHRKDNEKELGLIIPFSWVILIGTMVLCIAVQLEEIFSNTMIYGIFYSSGMSSGQIRSVIIFENIMIIFVPLFISVLVLYNSLYLFSSVFGEDPRFLIDLVRMLYFKRVMVQEILISLCVFSATCGIPMIIFLHITPADMLRGFYE